MKTTKANVQVGNALTCKCTCRPTLVSRSMLTVLTSNLNWGTTNPIKRLGCGNWKCASLNCAKLDCVWLSCVQVEFCGGALCEFDLRDHQIFWQNLIDLRIKNKGFYHTRFGVVCRYLSSLPCNQRPHGCFRSYCCIGGKSMREPRVNLFFAHIQSQGWTGRKHRFWSLRNLRPDRKSKPACRIWWSLLNPLYHLAGDNENLCVQSTSHDLLKSAYC